MDLAMATSRWHMRTRSRFVILSSVPLTKQLTRSNFWEGRFVQTYSPERPSPWGKAWWWELKTGGQTESKVKKQKITGHGVRLRNLKVSCPSGRLLPTDLQDLPHSGTHYPTQGILSLIHNSRKMGIAFEMQKKKNQQESRT